MKIWVIGRGYPTPANKMWGSFELEQAKLLARKGHEVSYIALTLSFFDRQDKRGLRTFTEDNVSVYTYSHFYFPGKLGIYLENFEDKCWMKLFEKAEKNSGKPDIIHVHYPSMISSINKIEQYRKNGTKIFATEHWSRVLINNLHKHEKKRLEYYAANASCFASVGKPLQEAVKKLVPVNVPMEIIPNVISPRFFSKQCKKNDNSEINFIAVGRLVPLKQFDKIIKSFRSTFDGRNDVRLTLIGSGSERKNLEEIAGNDQRIRFLGELPLADVEKEVANADVLVSFSKYETFGVPVAEAWACGKPAIVSRQSGIAAFVDDSNGMVVSSDSSEQLCDAMKNISVKYNDYDSDKIREFAKEHFSDDAIIQKITEMYEKY